MNDVIAVKLGRRFDTLDADRDGYVEWDDHQRFVDRCLNAYGTGEEERKGIALQAIYKLQWSELLRHAEGDGDRLSKDEYVNAVRRAILDSSRFNMAEGVPHAVFDIMDTDEDDMISQEEFAKFLHEVWGVAAPEAMEVFTGLDADRDDRISRQEFLRSVREFYYSADPGASGSKYFGRV